VVVVAAVASVTFVVVAAAGDIAFDSGVIIVNNTLALLKFAFVFRTSVNLQNR